MHKKRLRKKIGKRVRTERVRQVIALATVQAAGMTAAAHSRVAAIASTYGVPAAAKAAAQAQTAIEWNLAIASCFDPVRVEKNKSPEAHYRERMGYVRNALNLALMIDN